MIKLRLKAETVFLSQMLLDLLQMLQMIFNLNKQLKKVIKLHRQKVETALLLLTL